MLARHLPSAEMAQSFEQVFVEPVTSGIQPDISAVEDIQLVARSISKKLVFEEMPDIWKKHNDFNVVYDIERTIIRGMRDGYLFGKSLLIPDSKENE